LFWLERTGLWGQGPSTCVWRSRADPGVDFSDPVGGVPVKSGRSRAEPGGSGRGGGKVAKDRRCLDRASRFLRPFSCGVPRPHRPGGTAAGGRRPPSRGHPDGPVAFAASQTLTNPAQRTKRSAQSEVKSFIRVESFWTSSLLYIYIFLMLKIDI